MLDQEDGITGDVIPGHWRNVNKGEGALALLRLVGRRAPVDTHEVCLLFVYFFLTPQGHIERQAIVE